MGPLGALVGSRSLVGFGFSYLSQSFSQSLAGPAGSGGAAAAAAAAVAANTGEDVAASGARAGSGSLNALQGSGAAVPQKPAVAPMPLVGRGRIRGQREQQQAGGDGAVGSGGRGGHDSPGGGSETEGEGSSEYSDSGSTTDSGSSVSETGSEEMGGDGAAGRRGSDADGRRVTRRGRAKDGEGMSRSRIKYSGRP